MRTRFGIIALALVSFVAAGCSSTASVGEQLEADTPTPGATAELEEMYWARIDSSRAQFTDADVAFMTGMIGHHAQALVMSAFAPTHGANAEVQTLAARIDNAQRDEIETMQRWLRDRGQPVPEVRATGTMPMAMEHGADHGHGEHHMDMPGMLTPDQLRELEAARGATFDRLFLTYMIQHHGGAIVMVDDLFGADGAALDGEAFKLASDVQVDQRTEIARMQRMLDALPAPNRKP